VKDTVVDFVDLILLRSRDHVLALHSSNELILGLCQALRLLVAEQLIELLLAGFAAAVYACCFAEPIYRSFDSGCGGDCLDGVTESAILLGPTSTLGRSRCILLGFVLLHFLGY